MFIRNLAICYLENNKKKNNKKLDLTMTLHSRVLLKNDVIYLHLKIKITFVSQQFINIYKIIKINYKNVILFYFT